MSKPRASVCFFPCVDQRHKQVQQMTKGAKCFLYIRWLLPQYILHSRPNLANTIPSISPEDPPSLFIVEKHPLVEGAHHEAKRFWRIPIITSEFCATAKPRNKTGKWRRPSVSEREEGTKRIHGKGFKKMIQIMAQWRSCCWTPHKYYSRRNSTWPEGKLPLPSAGLFLAQSGHGLVWCPPPIRLVCSLLSHSKVI